MTTINTELQQQQNYVKVFVTGTGDKALKSYEEYLQQLATTNRIHSIATTASNMYHDKIVCTIVYSPIIYENKKEEKGGNQ